MQLGSFGTDGMPPLHNDGPRVGGMVSSMQHDAILLPTACSTGLGSHRFYRQYPLTCLGQFGSGLRVRVEHGEVTYDDWHGKSYRQDASESAYGTYEHSYVCFGGHVSVPYRRHSYYGPPETHWYGREIVVGVGLNALCVEDERGEDDDAEDEEEDEESQLVCTCFECMDENFQAWRMSGELEEPHDSNNAEELQNVVVVVDLVEDAVQDEGKSGHDVYDVDRFADENEFLRTEEEPDHDLESKPSVANTFHVKECLVGSR